jgi:DNA-binding transcriptional MerR regulator
MFTIGDFATFTQVSVPALRLWDRRGILVPARVDPDTGYRYYRAEQAVVVQRILALKELGFTLGQIGPILADPPSTEAIAGMLAIRRAEAERDRQMAEDRILAIEAKLHILDRSPDMHTSYDVIRKASPAVRLAATSQRLQPDSDDPRRLFAVFGQLFEQLSAALATDGVAPTGPAWSLYDRSDDAGIVVHAALPIAPDADITSAGVVVVDRPELDVASTIHLGDVAEMATAYAAIMEWLEARSLPPSGGAAEISLVWDPDHPERNVTELHLAIEPEA